MVKQVSIMQRSTKRERLKIQLKEQNSGTREGVSWNVLVATFSSSKIKRVSSNDQMENNSNCVVYRFGLLGSLQNCSKCTRISCWPSTSCRILFLAPYLEHRSYSLNYLRLASSMLYAEVFSFGIVIPSLLLQYCVIPSFDTDVVVK